MEKTIFEELEQFRKDNIFLESHQEEWRKEYPDKWAAVYQKKLVAVGNYDEVRRTLKEKGIPSERTVIQHLSTEIRPICLIAHRESRGVSSPAFYLLDTIMSQF